MIDYIQQKAIPIVFELDPLFLIREICQNVGFSEIDFTMTTKNFKIDKRLILRDLDQLKKIQH